ncbi:MAG: hypothetical protein JXR83_01085, partial [Deltaproteobacteria bacterium]|nr:hypothetical protein [Deltaproteobacteria bacterium]
MSLRAMIRVVAAAVVAIPLGLLLVPVAGVWPLLVGPGLLLLTGTCLALATGPGPVVSWQLRYYLPAGAPESVLDRLDRVLAFLVDRGHHVVLEVKDRTLILTAPEPLGEYVQVQIPGALPDAKLAELRLESANHPRDVFLATAPLPAAEVLRWATLAASRRVRLHFRDGGRMTLVAGGARPPGPWLRLPGPIARMVWHKAAVWDIMPAGTRLANLLPTTRTDSTFSSRSRLLELALPPDYEAAPGRRLGRAADGRWLTNADDTLLFLTAAPPEYLARLAVEDHRRDVKPVVLSPHRQILERIAGQVASTTWIDAENSIATSHLAVVPAAEWGAVSAESATRLAQRFLVDVGVDLSVEATRTVVQYLTYVLANSAYLTGNDFSFVDLYAVSQGIEALRAFLRDVRQLFPDQSQPIHARVARFEALLDTDTGYVQAVTALSAIRAALKPLRAGPVHNLAQPPYLDVRAVLAAGEPILVPLTNHDYPGYDRLLAAMLDLTLARVLENSNGTPRFALHLHEPQRFRPDRGGSWVHAARTKTLPIIISAADAGVYADVYRRERDAELIFFCSNGQAAALIRDEALPCTAADLVDLPAG